jgi:hypothetical protein
MKLIFSRKGFDSTAGRCPSPIVGGVPISLPIPTNGRSETSYKLAGLSEIVERVTKGRISGDDLCHEVPVFRNDRWAFGQTSAAQSHLENSLVGIGDVFLFFGKLFERGDAESFVVWMDNFCVQNPSELVGEASAKLVISLSSNLIAREVPYRTILRAAIQGRLRCRAGSRDR